MEDVTRLSRCSRCGAGLPIDAAGELCATCEAAVAAAPTIMAKAVSAGDETRIISAGGVSSSNDVTVLSGRTTRGPVAPKLGPGQTFGHYRIERLLGRGGMGDVYEAEHVEHERRVAIKVLNSALAGEEDRARFFDEGRAAASITHPHTVYIFGSEEIDGAPVIAMELLSGGTLRDLVQKNGPLAPANAVDAILQVIAGLDAANRAGLLHRDVKPANCFVDLNGDIKVGDFGLSITTFAHQPQTGMFLGTPQFAAPEQIRGEALDLRADIYAVGGTLFYLLTGQPPFNDQDLTTLVTRVTTEAPRSPREMSANVPPALAAIVMGCLAKDRNARPANYAVLEDLLRPFSSTAPVPASLRRRFLAGVLDQTLFGIAAMPLSMYAAFSGGTLAAQWGMALAQVPFWLAYFGVLEGLWGASVGKRILGTQVATTDGQRPGLARALTRALVYETPALLTTVPFALYASTHVQDILENRFLGGSVGLVSYGLVALLFAPARFRNGYAALHDRVSGTRVIRRRARSTITALDLPGDEPGAALAVPVPAGPFDVRASFGSTGLGELRSGFDPQLKRRIWVHVVPAGSAPIEPRLRDLARVARLRWLSGRRTASEAWDAYEAFDGLPLTRIPRPQRWGAVRRWLLDLAIEIDAGLKDGSLGALTLDRVWITRDGRARLLDFRAPGLAADSVIAAPADLASAQQWLVAVATRGFSGTTHGSNTAATLPLSGRTLIDQLRAERFTSTLEIVSQLSSLQASPDVVQPWRRAASVWIPVLGPVAGLLFGLISSVALMTVTQTTPDLDALGEALAHLKTLSRDANPESDLERTNVETYIAGTFRGTLTSPTLWTSPMTATRLAPYHALADHVLAAHPDVSPEELAAVKASLGKFIVDQQELFVGQTRRASIASRFLGTILTVFGLGMTAAFALLWAPIFRGGLLLRIFGLALVDAGGQRATRSRALLRALFSWIPAGTFILFLFLFPVLSKQAVFVSGHPGRFVIIALPIVVFMTGAIVATMNPSRGWQDRLARTHVVPR